MYGHKMDNSVASDDEKSDLKCYNQGSEDKINGIGSTAASYTNIPSYESEAVTLITNKHLLITTGENVSWRERYQGRLYMLVSSYFFSLTHLHIKLLAQAQLSTSLSILLQS